MQNKINKSDGPSPYSFTICRDWLRIQSFIITKSLNDYLKSNSISEEQSKFYCYIQSKIIISMDRCALDDSGFVRIGRQYWIDKIGKEYPKYLEILISLGEIERDDSYCFIPKNISEEKKLELKLRIIPKCKGYKVSQSKINTGLIKVDFKRRRVNPLKSQVKTDDEVSKYALECMKTVLVNDALILPSDDKRSVMVKAYCEKVKYGAVNLHRTKSGRCYHSIIEMPKEGRMNLSHRDGKLVQLDCKTFFPVLLSKYFTDHKERTQFISDLKNDIYSIIDPSAKTNSILRNSVKKRFSQYLAEKNRDSSWLIDCDIHLYFKKFPIFMSSILSSKGGLALKLQILESSIMVDALGSICKENEWYWYPMHDGCHTLEKYTTLISDKIKELVKSFCGYDLQVEFSFVSNSYNKEEEGKDICVGLNSYNKEEEGKDICVGLNSYNKEEEGKDIKCYNNLFLEKKEDTMLNMNTNGEMTIKQMRNKSQKFIDYLGWNRYYNILLEKSKYDDRFILFSDGSISYNSWFKLNKSGRVIILSGEEKELSDKRIANSLIKLDPKNFPNDDADDLMLREYALNFFGNNVI